MNIVALDVGGTKLAAAYLSNRVLRQRIEVATAADLGPDAVIDQMVQSVSVLPQATALAVACTGRVHGGLVTALNLQIMPGWTNIALHHHLERRTGLPVTLVNDADAAAYGEARLGAGQSAQSLLFVTISTGVGAGLILNGQLLTSASGIHSDFGYLRTPSGETIEAVAGGRALAQWMSAHHQTGGARQLVDWSRTNVQASERLDLAVSSLVRGFGDVRVLTGVETVVVGGSVGLNPEVFRRLQYAVNLQPEMYRVHLAPAALGPDAGLYGAALLAELGPTLLHL